MKLDHHQSLPQLRWCCDEEGSTIFINAVEFRQAEVFSLIHGFSSIDKMTFLVDEYEENILHNLEYKSVDKIRRIQGEVLKMQRELQWREVRTTELQWFEIRTIELKWLEEIEPMMPRDNLEKTNCKEKTTHQLFNESHKELMINTDEWMKDTSNSCIIVGLLQLLLFPEEIIKIFHYIRVKFSSTLINDNLPLSMWDKSRVSLFSSTTSAKIFPQILT